MWVDQRPTSLRKLALAADVLAVLPDHPFAVLGDVLRNERDGVLAVIVERHGADDGVVVRGLAQSRRDLLAVRTDLLDPVEDELHGGKTERAVRLRRLLVAGLV